MSLDDRISRVPRSQTASIRGTEQHDHSTRKGRRVPRACDMCRLKKLKCEGGTPSRRACVNCVLHNYDCTHLQTASDDLRLRSYIQDQQMRLANLEQLVRKLCPDPDVSQHLLDVYASPVTYEPSPIPSSSSTPPIVDENEFDSDEDDASAIQTITDHMQGFSFIHPTSHLVGRSSTLMLLRTVLDYKNGEACGRHSPTPEVISKNMSHVWTSHTWESRPSGPRHHFDFPGSGEMAALVENYFQDTNIHAALLHRPTFENNIARGLHLSDEGFGATVLLVCALGSRISDAPDSVPGHQWFSQVHKTLNFALLEPPRLYDLQIAMLAAIYVTRMSNASVICWLIVGHGIRMAQAIGVHRKKMYAGVPPVERELLKRAFWCLIKADRVVSYYLGRVCIIQDEDFDVDFPVECDDEYWAPEDPSAAFKQPEGKLSYITAFNWGIKLSQIQSRVMRTIYSITKSRVVLGHVGVEWEERTVRELDSALNQWLDSLPEQLRWNPKETNYVYLTMSAALNSAFHELQMAVHRPFITPRRQKSASFPSLMICTNAARSALRILDVHFIRAVEKGKHGMGAIGTILVSGMMLLLNVFHSRQAGSTAHLSADIELINKAVYMLMSLINTSQNMVSTCSFIELIRVGGLPVPRESDSPYMRSARSSGGFSLSTGALAPWQEPGGDSQPADAAIFTSLDLPKPQTDLISPGQSDTWLPPAHPVSDNLGVPQMSDNPIDGFLRTLEELATYAPVSPTLDTGHSAFDWNTGSREEGGLANYGVQWEEWGSLFASAFGVNGIDASGSGLPVG